MVVTEAEKRLAALKKELKELGDARIEPTRTRLVRSIARQEQLVAQEKDKAVLIEAIAQERLEEDEAKEDD